MSYRCPTDREFEGLVLEGQHLDERLKSAQAATTVYQELRRQASDAIILEHTKAIDAYLRSREKTTNALLTLAGPTRLRIEFRHARDADEWVTKALYRLLPFYRLLFDDEESWQEAQSELGVENSAPVTSTFGQLWPLMRQRRLVQPWYELRCYSVYNSVYTPEDASRLAADLLSWAAPFQTPNGETVRVLDWSGMDGREHLKTLQLAAKASEYSPEAQVRAFLQKAPLLVEAERRARREWSVGYGEQIGATHREVANYWLARIMHDMPESRTAW